MVTESVPAHLGHKLWKWIIRSAFSGFFAGFAFATMLLLYFQPQLRPYHEFVEIVTLFLGMSTFLSLAFWRLAHRSRLEVNAPNYEFKAAVRLSESSSSENIPEPQSKDLPRRIAPRSQEIPV